jgi:DNA polymerase IV
MAGKTILHIDMDAFFAAVEALDDASLIGKPVIVGGGSCRGVVSAASYEARRFGVHSAQPITTARRLCPGGIFRPPRMTRYREISARVFHICARFTPLVEALSIDEAFLDVSGSLRLFGSPAEIAARIKRCIRDEIGLTASAGIAPSKSVAKIASDLHKPDGLTMVVPERVISFLNDLPIEKLWGVGAVTRRSLSMLGIVTIGDLRRTPLATLEKKFGVHGRTLHQLAHGIDDRNVEPIQTAQSIGNEETFADDIRDADSARLRLLRLSMKVASRLRAQGVLCRTMTLKVKYSDFQQISRSVTLPAPTCDGHMLYQNCCALIQKTDIGRRPLRLLGVTASGLCHATAPRQPGLFDDRDGHTRSANLNRTIDRIQARYGDDSIQIMSLLKKKEG